jgi:teichuronic acid biosynthesis glycosyltransferase TuaC
VLPDGFAAVLLGKEFRLPVVCTAHGADINVYPFTSRWVRWATTWALWQLDRVITVSDNLRGQAVELGGTRLFTVVHNGADNASFKPMDTGVAIYRP